MNSQHPKTNTQSNEQNQYQPLSTSSISSIHNYLNATEGSTMIPPSPSSSLFPSQVSHMTNLFPLMNYYEDEQPIVHLLNQHFAINSSGKLGKAMTIIQPTITYDFPLLNERDTIVNQIRRSEVSHPYEYKASVNTKQIPRATLHTSALTMNGHDEETQGVPINVNHIYQQRPSGIKQIAKFISQLNVTTNYADLDESAVQLDQLHRPGLPQPIKYKILPDNQPSTGMIRKMPSVFGEEEPIQETSINLNHLHQPTVTSLLSSNTMKQQISSIMQPSTSTNLPILDETAIHLNRFHRPLASQNIQYKAPVGIQPSTGSLLMTTLVLSREEVANETPMNIIQLRQPIPKHLSTFARVKQQKASIRQPAILTDLPIPDNSAVCLNQIHRSNIPQPIRYKATPNIQPSDGIIVKRAFALSEEQPAEPVWINISQLRQPIPKSISPVDSVKQQVSWIVQPSIMIDSLGFDESSVQLGQIYRLNAPQTIQYRLPINIQPSTASLIRNISTLTEEQIFGGTSLMPNQIQQRHPQIS